VNLYTTQIKAIDPADGEMKTWCGPNVPGISFSDARWYCDNNGLGYCEVTGQLVCEIGTKVENGMIVPDFTKRIDYDAKNN
jgi:hypothetical protein